MKLFNFLKPKSQFEDQIRKLDGIEILDAQNSRIIKISNRTNLETIRQLLKTLRFHKVAFSLFDHLYPSPSDPGASIDYSQELNDSENSWSMTLGNHGWTGGIYTINDNNISIQIKNLTKQKLIDGLRIDNVKIFNHYDKENIDYNRNQNALIYGIHADLDEIKSDYLIFGSFFSDNYGKYYIYKLTNNELFVDNTETWHSQRHSKDGYVFKGEKLSHDKFEIAKDLLNHIPLKLMTERWKGFYTTGNKNEDQLILEFCNSNFHKTISIDSYEIETESLPFEIKNYRKQIENIIKELSE
jgi:hypothetical protein